MTGVVYSIIHGEDGPSGVTDYLASTTYSTSVDGLHPHIVFTSILSIISWNTCPPLIPVILGFFSAPLRVVDYVLVLTNHPFAAFDGLVVGEHHLVLSLG